MCLWGIYGRNVLFVVILIGRQVELQIELFSKVIEILDIFFSSAMMRDTKTPDNATGFLPVTCIEDGILDGGETHQYIFPGIQVVEVVSKNRNGNLNILY
jgi:hypothetical protein